MTKAMEILNEMNGKNENELYTQVDRIKGILTVLDVYEDDILDSTLANNELVSKKYDKILQFLRESAFNERKQTYDLLAITPNMGNHIVYSAELIYNNYIINDIRCILNVLDNEHIIDLVLDENESKELTNNRIVVDYSKMQYLLKRCASDADKEVAIYKGSTDIDFYPNYERFNAKIDRYFDKDSSIEMSLTSNIECKLTDLDCKKIALYSNMCIDMGVKTVSSDVIRPVSSGNEQIINNSSNDTLFIYYMEAMKDDEVSEIINTVK